MKWRRRFGFGLVAIIAASWTEVIRGSLWMVLATILIAGVLTGLGAYLMFVRDEAGRHRG